MSEGGGGWRGYYPVDAYRWPSGLNAGLLPVTHFNMDELLLG